MSELAAGTPIKFEIPIPMSTIEGTIKGSFLSFHKETWTSQIVGTPSHGLMTTITKYFVEDTTGRLHIITGEQINEIMAQA